LANWDLGVLEEARKLQHMPDGRFSIDVDETRSTQNKGFGSEWQWR